MLSVCGNNLSKVQKKKKTDINHRIFFKFVVGTYLHLNFFFFNMYVILNIVYFLRTMYVLNLISNGNVYTHINFLI